VPKVWHNAWKSHNQTCLYFQQFETERVLVAHWAETIAVPEARRRLATQLPDLLTPDVIAHLPPFFDLTDQNMDQWIDARDAESDIYLIREKGTDALIGLMFLTPSFNNDIHLEYLLGQSAWGKGYASELLAGLVLHVPKTGFRLLGAVGRENPASAHVLRKTGFHIVPELSDRETEMFDITCN
jgi:RimJ/RimL family protein N-acetyltransferase